jgi:hypothetical protein
MTRIIPLLLLAALFVVPAGCHEPATTNPVGAGGLTEEQKAQIKQAQQHQKSEWGGKK